MTTKEIPKILNSFIMFYYFYQHLNKQKYINFFLLENILIKGLYDYWCLYTCSLNFLFSLGLSSYGFFRLSSSRNRYSTWAQALLVCDPYFLLNSLIENVLLLKIYHFWIYLCNDALYCRVSIQQDL